MRAKDLEITNLKVELKGINEEYELTMMQLEQCQRNVINMTNANAKLPKYESTFDEVLIEVEDQKQDRDIQCKGVIDVKSGSFMNDSVNEKSVQATFIDTKEIGI